MENNIVLTLCKRKDFDINDTLDKYDHTLLMIASMRGNVEIVRWIINIHGKNVNLDLTSTKQAKCKTALLYACTENYTSIVRLLVSHGAKIDVATFPERRTPLMYAYHHKNQVMINILVAQGITPTTINSVDEHGNTPLMYACLNCEMGEIDDLISYGADIDASTSLGATPLVRAIASKRLHIVMHVLDYGANIYTRDTFGETPLIAAAYYGLVSVINVLLNHDMKLTLQGNGYVSDYNDENKIGPRSNKWIDAQDNMGYTALMKASVRGKVNAVKRLIDFGANIHIQKQNGDTALHLACRQRQREIVQMLLDHGANAILGNERGETPITIATQNGYEKLSRMLCNTLNCKRDQHRSKKMEQSPIASPQLDADTNLKPTYYDYLTPESYSPEQRHTHIITNYSAD